MQAASVYQRDKIEDEVRNELVDAQIRRDNAVRMHFIDCLETRTQDTEANCVELLIQQAQDRYRMESEYQSLMAAARKCSSWCLNLLQVELCLSFSFLLLALMLYVIFHCRSN